MGINFDLRNKNVAQLFEEAKAPVKVTINMTQLEDLFSKAANSIKGLVDKAEEFNITSVDTRSTAIEMGTQAKQLENLIEKKRKEMKSPALEFGQTLDGMVRPLKVSLSQIQTGLKRKIKVHIDAENKRKALAEQERLKVEAALNPEIVPPEAPSGTSLSRPVIQSKQKTGSGSMSVKKVWKYKVVDLSKVPANFMTLDEKAVKAAMDLGTREIPGLEIYEDSDINLTVARKGGPINGRQ